MINERQVYDAKVFLRSYRDALICIEQSVIKRKTYEQYQFHMVEANDNFDEFSRGLFKFSKSFLNKYFKPEPATSAEFFELLEKIRQVGEGKS